MADSIVLLRVFVFGLIAFVTPSVDRPDPFAILLLDARHPPHATDSCPIQPHEPELIFHNPFACRDPCYTTEDLCRCGLDRESITFRQAVARQASGPFAYLADFVPEL